MPKIFVIEDQGHAEHRGEFASLQGAWRELERLSRIPWDQSPNIAPCQSWRTCGRDYEILEYETSSTPWVHAQRHAGLEISAKGVIWGTDYPHHEV
jgi:hypothetical protein